MLNGNCARLRRALLVSIAGMVALPAAAASPETDLTQNIFVRIHRLAPSVALEVAGPLTLHVIDGPQAGGQINFDRVAAFCEHNDAAACDEQKQKFAAGIAASLVTTDYAVTRERLRVVVRSEQYAADANAQLGAGKSGPLVIAPLAAGLDLVLAADFPQTTRLVNEGDLKTLGLTREQAIAIGTTQVLTALPPLPEAKELQSAVIVIPGNDYGASYMLASDQWQSRARNVTGVLWIAVPADERVVVGVARSEAELGKLKLVVAQDFATAPRGISPLIFRWASGRWLPLK